MRRSGEPFESFREGLAAGHDAGRSHDLLYAAGFLVGFVWGAIAERRRHAQAEPFERATQSA